MKKSPSSNKDIPEVLQDIEEQFKALVNSSPDCIKLFNLKGKLIYLSPAGRLEHRLAENADICHFNPRETIKESSQEYFDNAFKDAKKGKTTTIEVEHTKEGANRDWCLMTIAPVLNKKKKIIAIFGVSRDISNLKKTEENLKRLNILRNKFIQIISHQLRTPLSSINWNLELLLNGDLGILKETQEEFIRSTYNQNKGIIKRIDDLLTVMDIEEHRTFLEIEEISLEDIWGNILMEYNKQIKLKELKLLYTKSKKKLRSEEHTSELQSH